MDMRVHSEALLLQRLEYYKFFLIIAIRISHQNISPSGIRWILPDLRYQSNNQIPLFSRIQSGWIRYTCLGFTDSYSHDTNRNRFVGFLIDSHRDMRTVNSTYVLKSSASHLKIISFRQIKTPD